jgi:hypothetical protein
LGPLPNIRLANLELEAETLQHYADMTREGLEAYTPEDKHDAYKALRLRVVLHPDGSMEADGVFTLELPPIGWQNFVPASTQSDPAYRAFPPFLDTYTTHLLGEPPNNV